ncbi:MAG: hypothetical protein IPG76_21935 [Acidobacteria bacterium]|nr:hypothetical protein [Acidobacteriota bacterium]
MKERNGLLSIRMNNQLEEVIFFDQVRLLAVDHPADTEIHPNERLLPGPPYPDFKIFTTKSSRPPVAATDDKGNDILPLIKDIDRKYPKISRNCNSRVMQKSTPSPSTRAKSARTKSERPIAFCC